MASFLRQPVPAGVGKLIDAHPWDATPLGPRSRWPAILRAGASLMQSMPQPAWIAWSDEALLLHNDACIPLFGGGDVLGRPLAQASPALWSAVSPHVDRVRAGGACTFDHLAIGAGRGRTQRFSGTCSPLHDDAGAVRGALWVAMAVPPADVEAADDPRRDERMRPAGEKRFVEAMLSSIPDYAYAFDRTHRFAYTNRAMQGLFGRSAEEMVGRSFADLDYPPELARRLDRHLDHVFRTGETVADEVFYTSPTGVSAYFDFVWGPVLDGAGDVELVVGISRDVTQRRLMEEAVRGNASRQTFLMLLSDALRRMTDPSRIQTEASRLLARHMGVSRAVFDEYGTDDRVEQDSPADGVARTSGRDPHTRFGQEARCSFERDEPMLVEDVNADPRFTDDERVRYAAYDIAACISVGLKDGGRVVAAFGVHSRVPRQWTHDDVLLVREVGERIWSASKRARAESDLAQSRQRLAAIFSNAAVGLSEVDAQGRFVRVNSELCRILGRSHAQLVGCPIVAVTHPDDLANTLDTVARVRDTGRALSVDTRYVRGDGSIVWANSSVTPSRGPDGLAGSLLVVTVDLTERRAAEAARRESELLLRQFSEASSDLLWIRDARTMRCEYLSRAFATMYGEPVENAMGADLDDWMAFVAPEDRDQVRDAMDRVRGGESLTFEFRIRRADGEIRWIRDTGFPLLDADGRVERTGGIAQDVTGTKRVEAALAESEARLRTVLEGIPQLVWRSRDGGDWTWASRQWGALTGQTFNESLGRGWLEKVHPDDRARAMEAWSHAHERGILDTEFRVLRHDGVWLWHHTRSLPRRDGKGRILEWLGTWTDVEELKDLQAQQHVLVAELQHRTRNLIGVVRSIADRTVAGSASMDDFKLRFRDRMAALARVQGLLSQREAGQRVTFDQVLHAELAGLGVLDRVGEHRQIVLDGPDDVGLRSATVQTFALGLHELATNAVKYGALSKPDGRLSVRWRVENCDGDESTLCVDWVETGVQVPAEAFAPDARRGYGRELIERALPYQLRAQTSFKLQPDGVACMLRVPLAKHTAARVTGLALAG